MCDELRIYVADLHAYNCGELRGGWIDVDGMTEVSEIWDEIKERKLLGRNGDEWNEYAIHDHEGFGNLYGEFMGLDKVIEIAKLKEEASDNSVPWEAVRLYCEDKGELRDISEIAEQYRGQYESFKDYAEELFDECYLADVPEFVQDFIDYEAYARSIQFDYTVFRIDCFKTYIFLTV